MTMRIVTMTLVTMGFTTLLTGRACAQGVNPYAAIPNYNAPNFRPYAMPGLSPYLNIFGGGNNRNFNNAAINYYNFALPALQAQNPVANYYAGGNLQQQYTAAQLQPGDDISLDPMDPTSRLPRPSSHPTAFNNVGGYFNSFGTIGSTRPPQQNRPQQQPAATGRK
ncbi:MAG: hypothetical protein U0746_02620 [Gemmataceae bacterium]